MCLQIGKKGTPGEHLFVGDTLFAGSIGRTDLPGGDYDDADAVDHRACCSRWATTAIVHPGHGPDTTIRRERTTNPFVLEYPRREALVRFPQRDELNAAHLKRSPDASRAVSMRSPLT